MPCDIITYTRLLTPLIINRPMPSQLVVCAKYLACALSFYLSWLALLHVFLILGCYTWALQSITDLQLLPWCISSANPLKSISLLQYLATCLSTLPIAWGMYYAYQQRLAFFAALTPIALIGLGAPSLGLFLLSYWPESVGLFATTLLMLNSAYLSIVIFLTYQKKSSHALP